MKTPKMGACSNNVGHFSIILNNYYENAQINLDKTHAFCL